MDKNEKIALLEEILDMDAGSLKEDIALSELFQWDSIAVITFISLIDKKFNKILTPVEIRKFKTIGDLLIVME